MKRLFWILLLVTCHWSLITSADAYVPKDGPTIDGLVTTGYGALTHQRCLEIGTTVKNTIAYQDRWDLVYAQLQTSASSDERAFAASLFTGSGPNPPAVTYKSRWDLIDWGGVTNSTATIFVSADGHDSGSLIGIRGTPMAFATLSAAAAAAQSGDTIHVLSDLAYSGAVQFNVRVTIDFHWHKITSASQTDTRKITISADGCTIQNLEINGTWDGVSSGTTTGAAIRGNNKRFIAKNIYIHDVEDTGFELNGDFSGDDISFFKVDKTKLIGFSANSQGTTVINPRISFFTITNTGDKGFALARGGGGEINPVYGVDINHGYVDHAGAATGIEGFYLHGITGLNLDGIFSLDSKWNVSLDSCDRVTLSNINVWGGRSDQYSGIELAWCRHVSMGPVTLDGTAATRIAPASNGASLPQGTINATSTAQFQSGGTTIIVTTAAGNQTVTCTGLTDSTFTGCSGGTGAMSTGGTITQGSNQGTGIVASTFSVLPTAAGPYEINGADVTAGWQQALSMTYVFGIEINGGAFTANNVALNFIACGNVQVTGATLATTATSGFTVPLNIDSGSSSNDTAYSSVGLNRNYQFTGNFFNASSGATNEASILSQDATDTIAHVSFKNNKKVDAQSFGTPVALSGTSVTDVTIDGNTPASGWNNDANPIFASANTWTATQAFQNNGAADGSIIEQMLIESTQPYDNASNKAGIEIALKYTSGGAYAGMGGLTVTKSNPTSGDTSAYVSLHGRANGSNPSEVFRGDPTSGYDIFFLKPQFSDTNTTGSGAAALGANSPATTNTAPYTWIQIKTADGSIAYIPAWK